MPNSVRHKFSYILPALLLACAIRSHAQQPAAHNITVRLDPAQSEIHWTLSGNIHTVHGTFRLKAGLITFDPATGVAEGEILVDTATGQSGDNARDSSMQKEVLESVKYPQAIFHPQKVSGAVKAGGIQNVTVDGTFTIHGSDHPVSLPMQIKIDGSGQATAATRFVVPYVAWGMKDPSAFVLRVRKQVEVEVTAKGAVEGLQP